ncbi:MAG: hypothetical protein HFH68_01600 [Lachnospiraceae bacterium]|nr:hypothetical protein [Lachnospiraceae bacterium]
MKIAAIIMVIKEICGLRTGTDKKITGTDKKINSVNKKEARNASFLYGVFLGIPLFKAMFL